jgi:hypothetical protein
MSVRARVCRSTNAKYFALQAVIIARLTGSEASEQPILSNALCH